MKEYPKLQPYLFNITQIPKAISIVSVKNKVMFINTLFISMNERIKSGDEIVNIGDWNG